MEHSIREFEEENQVKEIQFQIEINASKKRVWKVLWEDRTFRDWANKIDEGTYIEGEIQEGKDIQFLSSVNGYGVTSLVEKFRPEEVAVFRHRADTKKSGQQTREKEWTGGLESYSLKEKNGVTTLVVVMDIPLELEEIFQTSFPKAMERIKELSEK